MAAKTEPPLSEIELAVVPASRSKRYPFSVPTIASLKKLRFSSRVIFFVGENGSGKSTLLEAIAVASGLAFEGGSRNFLPIGRPEFAGESQEALIYELADELTLRWRKLPRDAFFLRAESFYNVASYLDELGPVAFRPLGGTSLHAQSHGESFITLLVERFSGGGLYLIDEPEAALSVARQLAMLARMHDLVEAHPDTQFVIATHSPIVLAYPGAQILSFDRAKIEEIDYRNTDAYNMTLRFLSDPEGTLANLFETDRPEARLPGVKKKRSRK